MKKHYGIIVTILTIVLGVGMTYALFSTTINIAGTAKTTGTFEVIIDNATTATKLTTQLGSTNALIAVSSDQKKATISVPELAYPGAYAEFQVVLENTGSINAVLKSITTTGLDNPDIVVTYSGISQNDVINATNTKTVTVKVQWNANSTTTNTTGHNFDIEFHFQQET